MPDLWYLDPDTESGQAVRFTRGAEMTTPMDTRPVGSAEAAAIEAVEARLG
jgi:hypothetical protein